MNVRAWNLKTIINFIKEFKELKEDRKKQLNELKEKELKESKCLSDAQENTKPKRNE